MGTLLSFLLSLALGASAPLFSSLMVDSSLMWEGESLTFNYDEQFQEQPIPEDSPEAGILASFYIEEPPILLMVREEEGLRTPASVAQQSVGDFLRGEVERQLPKRYPNYEAMGGGDITIDGFDSFYFDFEYHQDGVEDNAKQRFVVVPVSDDKAIYISYQVRAFEFDDHILKLEKILDSVDVR